MVSTPELSPPVAEAPVRIGAREVELLEPASQASSAHVERAILEVMPELRTCSEHGKSGALVSGGKMKVSITGEPSGAVRRVRTLENTTGSDAMARCVEGRLRRMRVEPDPEGRESSSVYTLIFHDTSDER